MANVIINDINLTAIADAIRGKNGETTTYKPSEMATAITNLPTGGGSGIEIEPILLTGEQPYSCSGVVAAAAIQNLYKDKITTSGLTTTNNMFMNSTLKEIPFDLNYATSTNATLSYMFSNAVWLERLPAMNNVKVNGMDQFCQNARRLREVPEDFGENWDWSRAHSYNYTSLQQSFYGCTSLRKLPTSFLKNLKSSTTSNYSSSYYRTFYECFNIDEITQLGVMSGVNLTSNCFNGTFYCNYCLKRMTFETQEDGSPIVANWKGQTVDLGSFVGYSQGTASTRVENFIWNSGRDINKRIYDDTTYAAYKNDPDAFVHATQDYEPWNYAFYNHDSAVETINSLPDTSAYLATAGGTNTIKFRAINGAKTDGGAINTLTEEEIAVAAAKGWTVTLV